MARRFRFAHALALAAAASLAAAPARAIDPDGDTRREPYAYPAGPDSPEGYPDGWVRVPAAIADVLVVRPVMAVGLAIGAGLFVAALPVTVPTLTADDAGHALVDQTKSAFTRPIGEF